MHPVRISGKKNRSFNNGSRQQTQRKTGVLAMEAGRKPREKLQEGWKEIAGYVTKYTHCGNRT
jgi:hypothetical protein